MQEKTVVEIRVNEACTSFRWLKQSFRGERFSNRFLGLCVLASFLASLLTEFLMIPIRLCWLTAHCDA